MISRVLSVLLALVTLFCSGLALLIGIIWGLGLKCDDACSPYNGWRGDPDAWQWNAIAALGVAVFALGFAFFMFVVNRKPWYAAATMVLGFAGAAFLTGVFSSDWIAHLDRRSPGELLLMTASVLAPVLAVLLTPSGAAEVRPDRGRG
jgi:hypothetical protein